MCAEDRRAEEKSQREELGLRVISILVPAFNEEKRLGACLEAIKKSGEVLRAGGWDWGMVVCDNNSTDGTAEVARAAGVEVVWEGVNQIGRARDAAARAARGEFLLFVDADTLVSGALFGELLEVLERERPLAVGATMVMDSGGWKGRVICGGWNLISRISKQPAGSFLMVDREVFWEVGGFGTEWYAAEEIALVRRMKKAAAGKGRRVRILSRAPVVTSGRKVDHYSIWEMIFLVGKAVVTAGGSLRGRGGTQLWYERRE